MTPKQVKRQLHNIRHLRAEILTIGEQLQYIRQRAEYNGGMKEAGTGTGTNINKQEETLIMLLTYEELLQKKQDALLKAEMETEKLINLLTEDEAKYRTVLRTRFLLCKTQEQTADILKYSWRQVRRIEWTAICIIAKRCPVMSS